MEKLLQILEDIVPEVDFNTETALVDKHILTSFNILSIVSEIEDEFDVELSPADLIPDNFNSAKNLWNLIEKRMNEN